MKPYPGFFITFEGIDGAGKTTLIEWLAKKLEMQGRSIFTTREPGGTQLGTKIRELVKTFPAITPEAELLLFGADCAQHVRTVIKPALDAGKVVLCDRFTDSTIAYQACAHNLGIPDVQTIISYSTAGIVPDLTILLDLPIEEARKRSNTRGNQDKFDSADKIFHQKVREGFLNLANCNPNRIKVVDAFTSPDLVQKHVFSIIKEILQ